MVSVITNLDTLVEAYLNDAEYQEKRRQAVQLRDRSISKYKRFITDFLDGASNLETFREDLKALHQDTFWGAHGTGFLMEIHKLATHHAENAPQTEANLRLMLTDLNMNNLGQRIEQFYTWLEQEKTRLLSLGKSFGEIASQGSSAFIISLLAFWLNYPQVSYIYYPSLRQGLAMLLKARIIPLPSDIHSSDGDKSINVRSDADHQAVSRTLDHLAMAAPQLKADAYWSEQFFYWLVKRSQFFNQGSIAPDGLDMQLESEPEAPVKLLSLRTTVADEPLRPTPEPLLTQLVRELQQHILVEESLVRRIYEALLMGHVILTGPPGTGKTELARHIPELLWQSESVPAGNEEATEQAPQRIRHTAYTTSLVTATSDWSGRTLIGGIAPTVNQARVSYRREHGHLTNAILENWDADMHDCSTWESPPRARLMAQGVLQPGIAQEFHGHWLIIDEFNRAQIDVALGEALTTLGNGEALLLTIEGKPVKLRLPRDFRIIGTLNSFDRSYLNQISEALKRRFSFVEVSPPSRAMRGEEQVIVINKAFTKIEQLGTLVGVDSQGRIIFEGAAATAPANILLTSNSVGRVFDAVWDILEVIRIYRQLGTAQAITLVQRMMLTGIMRRYDTDEQWMNALDIALCDTIADQLQVLLPDELDVLLWHLKLDAAAFINKYNEMLERMVVKPRRLAAHLEALNAVVGEDGKPLLSDDEVEIPLGDEQPRISPTVLTAIFHLDHTPYVLPQFVRRLRTFKAERGL